MAKCVIIFLNVPKTNRHKNPSDDRSHIFVDRSLSYDRSRCEVIAVGVSKDCKWTDFSTCVLARHV